MIEIEGLPQSTPQQRELYERAVGREIDVFFIDEEGVPREPTRIETEATRIWDLYRDRMYVSVSDDGNVVREYAWLHGVRGTPLLERVYNANGEHSHFRFSGAYFTKSIANEWIYSEPDGSLSIQTYPNAIEQYDGVKEYLKLYSKLRHVVR